MSDIARFRGETGAALRRLPSLAGQHPEAEAILVFYGRVLEQQLAMAEGIAIGGTDISAIVWREHVGRMRGFLDLCVGAPTAEIAAGASALQAADDAHLAGLVEAFLREKTAAPVERFIVAGFLGGALVPAASLATYDRLQWLKDVCPVCGFPPVVSFLADEGDVEGGRFARCGICHAEWYANRGNCIACGTANDDHLHYYVPDKVPSAVTVQACEECGSYIKMVDTRGMAQATPELDDIATLSLDIAVTGKGYRKISPNLFGI